MAQLAANPWKITSADAFPLVCARGSTKLRHIEYANYAANSTGAVIQDINGNDIIILKPDTATSLETLRTANIGYVTGVQVTACPSGEVTIYFE
jgi:hypothetical protein